MTSNYLKQHINNRRILMKTCENSIETKILLLSQYSGYNIFKNIEEIKEQLQEQELQISNKEIYFEQIRLVYLQEAKRCISQFNTEPLTTGRYSSWPSVLMYLKKAIHYGNLSNEELQIDKHLIESLEKKIWHLEALTIFQNLLDEKKCWNPFLNIFLLQRAFTFGNLSCINLNITEEEFLRIKQKICLPLAKECISILNKKNLYSKFEMIIWKLSLLIEISKLNMTELNTHFNNFDDFKKHTFKTLAIEFIDDFFKNKILCYAQRRLVLKAINLGYVSQAELNLSETDMDYLKEKSKSPYSIY